MTDNCEHEERIAGLIEENAFPDEGVDEVLGHIEESLDDLKETLAQIATRPGGRGTLERVGTYLRCWNEELSNA